jgi:peptidoglycan hydrolase-like protein with peptidoglycan-binding domain
MSNKFLSDGGWKDVATKSKIKDNGLLKLLTEHKRIDADEHDDALDSLDQILKLASQLKKSKDVAAVPAALKYVGDLTDAAETERRAIAKAKAESAKAADAAKADAEKKAKAEAEKKSKADADAKKREDNERKDAKGQEGDELEEEASALLTTKMIPLLRQVAKGETMHALVASSGKQVVVMISRRPIAPARRKLLADELGVSGGIKYIVGHCMKEEGMTTFALKTQVAGMAKKMKLALLQQTGLRVKLRCRGEDGETDDDLEEPDDSGAPKAEDGEDREDGKSAEDGEATRKAPEAATRPFEIGATVGKGGKNLEEDVRAVQIALNRRAGAGLDVNGRCGKDTLEAIVEFQRALGQSKPDGRVDPGRGTARALAASGKIGKPPPAPNPIAPPADLGEMTLAKAPLVWHGARSILDHNIKELKRAIRQEYANEHPKLMAEVDENVDRVDVILEKLDVRLAHALERAAAAKTPAQKKGEIAGAKAILADYISFVKTEPLIEHIDKNPFGVNAQVRKVITDSLTHIIKSIA